MTCHVVPILTLGYWEAQQRYHAFSPAVMWLSFFSWLGPLLVAATSLWVMSQTLRRQSKSG
ncbi:MAG TPA: hypothetical protein VF627_02660 [Abditibacterium sp.]